MTRPLVIVGTWEGEDVAMPSDLHCTCGSIKYSYVYTGAGVVGRTWAGAVDEMMPTHLVLCF